MNTTMLIIFMALALIQLGAIVWLYHKLSGSLDRIAKQTNVQSDNLFKQIEALMSLYAEMTPLHGLPPTRGWAASPDFLSVLVRTVNAQKPVTIVECSSGLSTLLLASSLKNLGRGKVLSLEHDPIYAEKTRLMLRQHGLEDFAEVIDSPLKDLTLSGWSGQWYDIATIPEHLSIDMLVVDGPPSFTSKLARYPAYPILSRYFSNNTFIILDDAYRESERLIIEKWLAGPGDLIESYVDACEKGCVILELKRNNSK